MATQGIVSVVNNQNQVVFKVVTGSDGYNAEKLATYFREIDHEPTLQEVYHKACQMGFGGEESLVVMGQKRTYHRCEGTLGRTYRKTFSDPHFNPRWKYGTAGYTEVVIRDW